MNQPNLNTTKEYKNFIIEIKSKISHTQIKIASIVKAFK